MLDVKAWQITEAFQKSWTIDQEFCIGTTMTHFRLVCAISCTTSATSLNGKAVLVYSMSSPAVRSHRCP